MAMVKALLIVLWADGAVSAMILSNEISEISIHLVSWGSSKVVLCMLRFPIKWGKI